MKLLWIGEYNNKEILELLLGYGYNPMSITIAQDNLIKGIKKYYPIDTISGCRLPQAKNINSIFFKNIKWEDSDLSNHFFVSLLNIKYLEIIYKSIMIKKAVYKWVETNKNEECHIIIYGLHFPYLTCIPYIKKIKTHSITCIVPDLPEFYDFNMSRFKKALKRIDSLIIDKYKKYIDRYILFSEKMSEYFKPPILNYLVMEGSINEDYYNKLVNKTIRFRNNKIILLYSGSVSYGYGLDKLIDAFYLIPDNKFELWIVGSGNAIKMINMATNKDKRIKYLGHINDREKLFSIQINASIMVNMIPPDNIATKYCFPSKLFEYMLSGNPVLSFRLEGINKEYLKYLAIIENTSNEAIANKIIEIGNLSQKERNIIGKNARDFILNHKTNYIQAEKILNFIKPNFF